MTRSARFSVVQSNSKLRALGKSVVEQLRDQVLAVQLRSGHLSKNERLGQYLLCQPFRSQYLSSIYKPIRGLYFSVFI